jgi:hypothetical protein
MANIQVKDMSYLPRYSDTVSNAKVVAKKLLRISFSKNGHNLSNATENIDKFLSERVKLTRGSNDDREVRDHAALLTKASHFLEAAIKDGDKTANTQLLLGATHILLSEWNKAYCICLALRDKGEHAHENMLAAMLWHSIAYAKLVMGSHANGGLGEDDLKEAIRCYSHAHVNEERAKSLFSISNSKPPEILSRMLARISPAGTSTEFKFKGEKYATSDIYEFTINKYMKADEKVKKIFLNPLSAGDMLKSTVEDYSYLFSSHPSIGEFMRAFNAWREKNGIKEELSADAQLKISHVMANPKDERRFWLDGKGYMVKIGDALESYRDSLGETQWRTVNNQILMYSLEVEKKSK